MLTLSMMMEFVMRTFEPILQDLPIIDFLMVMLLPKDVESPTRQSLPIYMCDYKIKMKENILSILRVLLFSPTLMSDIFAGRKFRGFF